jgi:hypothetical protein
MSSDLLIKAITTEGYSNFPRGTHDFTARSTKIIPRRRLLLCLKSITLHHISILESGPVCASTSQAQASTMLLLIEGN